MRTTLLVVMAALVGCAPDPEPMGTGYPVLVGDLYAGIRENQAHVRGYSGLAWLTNLRSGSQAFTFAGANWEHVISGSPSPLNSFAPRGGTLSLVPRANGADLIRRAEDDPRGIEARLSFTLRAPHYVDIAFVYTATRPAEFAPWDCADFFFASYMSFATDPEIHFQGQDIAGGPTGWTSSRSVPGKIGEIYGAVGSPPVPHDADPALSALDPVDFPRVAAPYYYGVDATGAVYAVMFDRLLTPADEIRFTVMRWTAARAKPAWDWQYLVRSVSATPSGGFRARIIWKPFVSADDIAAEYQAWAK